MNWPWTKWCWRDWQADSNLGQVSAEARGVWKEMLCIMAQARRYGYLESAAGTPMSTDVICRLGRLSPDELGRSMVALLDAGVPGVEEQTGVWFCRRMVREDAARTIGHDSGRRGGNPALRSESIQIPDTRGGYLDPYPPPLTPPVNGEFEEFWRAYPRKVGKGAARKAWAKAKGRPDVIAIIAAVEAAQQSDQWRRDGGKYIPHPATWLNQERWSDSHAVIMGKLPQPGLWRDPHGDTIP